MKKKFSLGKILVILALSLYSVLLFFPIITVIITSFTPSDELAGTTDFIWWPENFTLDAYKAIFEYDYYADLTGMPGLVKSFQPS